MPRPQGLTRGFTRPQGLTRDECRLTRAEGSLPAPSAPYTQPPAALRYLMIFTSPSSPILMMLLGWWGWCSWRRVQQT